MLCTVCWAFSVQQKNDAERKERKIAGGRHNIAVPVEIVFSPRNATDAQVVRLV